jgi:hypothetical protein
VLPVVPDQQQACEAHNSRQEINLRRPAHTTLCRRY